MKAPFIVLEGIDGSGKSTQVELVAKLLANKGFDYILTKEPGGTPAAEKMRNIFKGEALDGETQVLIAFAARNEHLKNKIIPNLNNGTAVVSDRFTDSTYAYQGAAGVDFDLIRTLEDKIQKNIRPDLVLFFNVDYDVSVSRKTKREADTKPAVEDQFDNKKKEYFEKAKQIYLDRADQRENNYVVLNANVSQEAVAKQVENIVNRFLEQYAQRPSKKSKLGM